MSKLTLEELQRMRERNRIVVELRDSDNKKAQIVVGMGTSGLAKGAKKVFNAFCDLVAEKGLVEVMVRQSGAMGHADLEPTVEVVAEGMESGGHIGETTTMNLVPQVADAVKIPVIAAGGIADGRGMAAAFMLGASGVQMGTRFVCASECNAHVNYKEKIVKANDRATVVTGRSLGHPVRALKNKFTKQFEELEGRNAPAAELEALGAGKLRLAVVEGDSDMGSFMSGQSAGLVHAIEPAASIIESVVTQMESILSGSERYVR